MKKRSIIACLSVTAALSLTASGCSIVLGGDVGGSTGNLKTLLKNAPAFVSKNLVGFDEDTSQILSASDGYTNGDVFGVYWNRNNVSFNAEDKTMELSVSKSGDKYYGGEVRTSGDVGLVQYGYFGCEMKPSNVVGTASTFFTYTGDPHDEIDIEFLGQDTTKVQFNYFVNGTGSHEYMYDLGFDASAEYHQYGFYWDEDTIVWYVDYTPVYAIEGETPSHPQRLYTNVWAGDTAREDIIAWMGNLSDDDLPATVSYRSMSVAYLNGSGLDVPVPEYVPDISEFKTTTVSFDQGSAEYTKENNTITYTNITPKSYKNVYGTVDENVKNAKYVALRLKNNGTEDYVYARVDVQSDTKNAAGLKAINEKAWQDGNPVTTDLKYGGSFFTLQPGEEAVCIVKFYGIPSNILLMLDSCTRTDKAGYSGSVTIEEVLYYGENDYVDERVSLDQTYLLLKPGETAQLNAESTGDVVWSVENANIATVENGLVTAVGEGSTTVTATTGSASVTCTVKVSSQPPKAEETGEIVAEEDDFAKMSSVKSGRTYLSQETENTYNTSTESVAWKGATAYDCIIFGSTASTYTITADGYIEYYFKSVGHTPSGNGETINGVFLQLYSGTGTKVGSEIKLYKAYNADCGTDAGNDWVKWKIPLSLFGADEGATFDGIRFKLYTAMNDGEAIYIDGLHFVTTSTANPAEGGNGNNGENGGGSENNGGSDNGNNGNSGNNGNNGNGGENGGNGGNGDNVVTVDKSAETLTICTDEEDLLQNTPIWANGTTATETVNTYGTSAKAISWSGCIAYENMMMYASADHSALTITDGYVEFFIKDTGHTSSATERSSGIILRLYNGSNSTKVDGVQDVKAYYGSSGEDYNAAYRTDAGNGWSYYKIPLTLFGTAGASFDRIRISTNVAFDDGEIMYLDGLRVVVQNTPTDNTGNGGNNTGNEGSGDNVATVDKSAETLTICTDAEDLMQKANIIGTPNGTAEAEKTNTYGASAEAVAWSGVAAYQNMFLYVSLDHSALTITADGYIEFFIKDTGHTSDATTRASGVNLVLYKDSSNKVDGFSANVSAYKTHNNEYRTDAGNGWSYYKIPLTLFGSVGASFDRIRFAANVAFDDGEIMYLDGLRVVVKNTTTENGATDNTTTGNTTTDNTATVDKGEFVTTSFTDNTQYCTITGDATSGYTLTTADRTYSRLRIPGKNYSTGMYQGKTLEFTFKPAAGSNVTVKLSTVDSSYTTSSYVTISLTDGYNQNGISVAYDQTTGEYTVIVNMDAFFAANALDGTQVRYLLLQIDGSAAQTELITFTGMYIY